MSGQQKVIDMRKALERAIECFDTAAAFADAVEVTPAVVSMWRKRGRVAYDKAIAVERATEARVTRYELRPDIYPR